MGRTRLRGLAVFLASCAFALTACTNSSTSDPVPSTSSVPTSVVTTPTPTTVPSTPASPAPSKGPVATYSPGKNPFVVVPVSDDAVSRMEDRFVLWDGSLGCAQEAGRQTLSADDLGKKLVWNEVGDTVTTAQKADGLVVTLDPDNPFFGGVVYGDEGEEYARAFLLPEVKGEKGGYAPEFVLRSSSDYFDEFDHVTLCVEPR